MGEIICFKACQGTITYYFCFWIARVLQMVKNLVLYKASCGWYLRLALSFQSYCKFNCNTWCCASKQLWDNIFWFCSRGCDGRFLLWFYLWGRTVLCICRHWSMQWTLFYPGSLVLLLFFWHSIISCRILSRAWHAGFFSHLKAHQLSGAINYMSIPGISSPKYLIRLLGMSFF